MNQKPISARIDYHIMWQIEQETMLGYYTRNRILNEGARLFLDLLDTRRNLKYHANPADQDKIRKGFLRKWGLE